MKITPVILSGGSGTRLWPMSRSLNPKQFLNFFDSKSLFSKTLLRVSDRDLFNPAIIICNENHRFLAADDIAQNNLGVSSIILEPVAKNTAPAIACAAFELLKNKERDEDLIFVMPSDHIIEDEKQFIKHIKEAAKLAENNYLVTFGIIPNSPETGYGYIEQGDEIENSNNGFKVQKFIEKPQKEKAEEFIKKGGFLWNSGIFLFKASVYLENLEKLQNNIFTSCKEAYEKSSINFGFRYLEKESFSKSDSDSIDYAVMEKSQNIAVIPINVGWNDVGSWDKIADISKKDENQNSLNGNVLALDTKNCYINNKSGLIATIGLENLIIVNFKDVTLIANKDNAQDIKKLFNILKERNVAQCNNHAKVLRPWGSFETIDIEDRFQVKRIIVNPKSSLSLQKHHKRSEHWAVVKGRALVTKGEEKFILETDQSTYIKVGEKHRLENQEDFPLEIIEVQIGDYLGEDDIVRFEDIYGRNKV